MECKQALEWMMESLDGELDAAGQAELDAHLSSCADCLGEWERLVALEQLLRQAPTVSPAPGFTGRVMARLDRWQMVRRVTFGLSALAVGAVATVALVMSPTILAFPSLTEKLVSVTIMGGQTLARVVDAAGTLLNSLRLTGGALLRPVAPLIMLGLLAVLAANLLWFEMMGRLQPARVNQSV